MNKNNIQLEFIEKIKSKISENINLAEIIADLLNISTDSAYRRIRSTTSFTIEEMEILCNHFKTDFNIGKQNSINANFGYRKISAHDTSIEEYLTEFADSIEQLHNRENNQLIIAANDIPPFYYFKEPELAAFKIFYWKNSILDEKNILKKFDLENIDTKTIETSKKIYHHFTQIPSIEIWTDSTFDSTLKQIEYYWESRIIEKEIATLLCNQTENILNQINEMAAIGSKSILNINYTMYTSDIVIGSNTVIMMANNFKNTFINFNTINALHTTNDLFCEEVEKWIHNLIKKSTLISQVAEKQRNQFIRINLEKINILRKKINN